MRIIIDVETLRADGIHDPAAVINNVIQALDSRKPIAEVEGLRLVINDRGEGIGFVEILHGEPSDAHRAFKLRMIEQLRDQRRRKGMPA